MQELLENLHSRFSQPLLDGRKMDFRLESARGASRIVVGTSRYCEARLLAIIVQSDAGYITGLWRILPTTPVEILNS